MSKARYDSQQLNDMVLQMMETELGGEQVYRTALTCAVNPDLKEEWEGYLQETLTHQDVVRSLCDTLGLDPNTQSPTRRVVKHRGESLVKAMQLAKQGGNPAAAQLVCQAIESQWFKPEEVGCGIQAAPEANAVYLRPNAPGFRLNPALWVFPPFSLVPLLLLAAIIFPPTHS